MKKSILRTFITVQLVLAQVCFPIFYQPQASAAFPAFNIPFSMRFDGQSVNLRSSGDGFIFRDRQGAEYRGSFSPAGPRGSISVTANNRRHTYTFYLRSSNNTLAMDKVEVLVTQLGGCNVSKTEKSVFEYDENNELKKYTYHPSASDVDTEASVEHRANQFWTVRYKSKDSAEKKTHFFSVVVDKDSLSSANFTDQSIVGKAFFVNKHAKTVRIQDAKTTPHTVEYVKNPQNQFTARLAIVGSEMRNYIVVGAFDLNNAAAPAGPHLNDPADLLIIQNQAPLGLDGYTVRFGERVDENGQFRDYGVILRNAEGAETILDYPAATHVTLEEKEYQVALTSTGLFQFSEINPQPSGQVSPFSDSRPANLVYWDYPTLLPTPTLCDSRDNDTADCISNPNSGDGDFDHIEIWRSEPGSTAQTLIATLPYLTNQYLDRDIETNYPPQLSYAYSARIYIKSGQFRGTAASIFKINHGYASDLRAGDLKPENVLVIASGRDSPKGKQQAILNGLDLVKYYVEQRGIPHTLGQDGKLISDKNVLLLNVEEDTMLENALVKIFSNFNNFKTEVLDPIHERILNLAAAGQHITAFTTMPGAHMTVRMQEITKRVTSIGDVSQHNIPAESVISVAIPRMIKGEDPSDNGTYEIDNRTYLFHLAHRMTVLFWEAPHTSEFLGMSLGYTRMAAPETDTMTAQQNLKRIIDQTIAAEHAAEAEAANPQGMRANDYVFIIDSRDLKPSLFGYGFGDFRFQTVERMLRDFGYTTFLDKKDARVSVKNPIPAGHALLNDLIFGNKKLYGYGGWHFPMPGGNGQCETQTVPIPNNQDKCGYLDVYSYMEHLTSNGFSEGSFITPLDSGSGSGWNALKLNGVVMATNAAGEPGVDGLSEMAGAYVYTGTSLAFATVKSARFHYWFNQVFGDPLFNMGKYILGVPRPDPDDPALTKTLVYAGKWRLSGWGSLDPLSGPREGIVDYSKDAAGRIVRSKIADGEEFYHPDGTKSFHTIDGSTVYEFDAQGRIVRELLNGTPVKTYTYDE